MSNLPGVVGVPRIHATYQSSKVVFLWNRTVVAFVDKLSSTTVDFIRSEGELKNYLMKSTVEDESLSTNATTVLFQRKLLYYSRDNRMRNLH